MEKWEYKLAELELVNYKEGHFWEVIPVGPRGKKGEEAAKPDVHTVLAQYGEQGWELVSASVSDARTGTVYRNLLIFKRRKP